MKFMSIFAVVSTLIYSAMAINTDTIMCVVTYRNNYYSDSNSTDACAVFYDKVNEMCQDYIKDHDTVSDIQKCFASNLRGSHDVYIERFLDFMVEYNKIYRTIGHLINRFYIFKDNMEFAHIENNKGHNYTLGPNFMADYTNAEYIDTFLNSDYTRPKDYCKDNTLSTLYADSVDWVEEGAVTLVKDQGQCGSCWAFSTVGALEGKNFLNTGNLISYSEQDLVSCASSYGNHGCNGGMMQRAFSYVIDNGISTESDYPYTSGTTTVNGECKESYSALHIKTCFNVPANEQQLTAASAQQPISVSIEADQRSFQLYTKGVYDDDSCGTTLDHGVLLVGYGNMDGQDYYRVKNSWSSSWGDNGYIYLARNSIASSETGMCGIAMDASYPGLA
jgi:hypothetical protein